MKLIDKLKYYEFTVEQIRILLKGNPNQIDKAIRLKKQEKIEKCRKSFYEFCKALFPSFYTEDKVYLKELCDELQAFIEGRLVNVKNKEYFAFILSIGPRFGKSVTLSLLNAFILQDVSQQVMLVTYDQKLSNKASKNVKDIINGSFAYGDIKYNEIFGDIKLKVGENAVAEWTLVNEEGRKEAPQNFKATSFGGSGTGTGCDLLIIDDPIRGSKDAINKIKMEETFDGIKDTFFSRIEGNGKLILCQTEWSIHDPANRMRRSSWAEQDLVYTFKRQAYNEETGEVLNKKEMPKEKYMLKLEEAKKNPISYSIFMANYQQKPLMDKLSTLYTNIDKNTYSEIPSDKIISKRVMTVDTASRGKDYWAAVCGVITTDNYGYILDMQMDNCGDYSVYEEKTALIAITNDINEIVIESNNEGYRFADNVEKILKDRGFNHITINRKHQSGNKETRLLVNAPGIQNTVFFNSSILTTRSEEWLHLLNFNIDPKKNKNDDLEDALTMFYENFVASKKNTKIQTGVINFREVF